MVLNTGLISQESLDESVHALREEVDTLPRTNVEPYVVRSHDRTATGESSLAQVVNERMTTMEKRIQELSEHCAKLESLLVENNDPETYPDVEKMYPEMSRLHMRREGLKRWSTGAVGRANLFPCSLCILPRI